MSTQIHVAPDATLLIQDLAEALWPATRAKRFTNAAFSSSPFRAARRPKNCINCSLRMTLGLGRFDWDKTVLLFGDDRAVGPDDPNSNFLMATQTLGPQISSRLGAHRRRRIRPRRRGQKLRKTHPRGGRACRCQLAGHGAGWSHGVAVSAFAATGRNRKAVWSPRRFRLWSRSCAASRSRLPKSTRRARSTFLVTEESKAARVQEVINGPRDVHNVPSTGVSVQQMANSYGSLDEAAASKLSPRP